jgi:ABC-type Fe3+ transport system substrate-binding protein
VRNAHNAEPRILPILRKHATEADAKLKRLYNNIENGVADLSAPILKDRIAELNAILDPAQHHTALAQKVRQAGVQAHSDRWRRLSP